MKIGVRAHDFGRMPVNELAATIKNVGFDCIQLAPTKAIEGIGHFREITERYLDEIKSAVDGEKLEIRVLGCYIEPSLQDKDKRLEQVGFFINGLTHAKKLDIPIVGTETTHLNIDASSSEREEIFQLLKDSVLRMIEAAERENIIVGIEPVAEHTLNTPELCRRLMDEVDSDKLKVIFDPVNLVLPSTVHRQQEIFKQSFELFGKDIVAVHMKDIVIEDEQKVWCKIGEGVIDYAFIFDWLKENKPDMRLLREGVQMDSYKQDLEAIGRLIL